MSAYDEKMKAHRAVQKAEAMSRRNEAVAMIHVSKGVTNSEAVKAVTGDTSIQDAQKAYHEAGRDLSGSTAGLSDSRGNHAATIDVAMTGGTGIDASNSRTGSEEPARNPEEAGDRIEGAANVVIPDNWESLSFRERANLAASLSSTGRQPRNGDEANEVIKAELDARNTTA